MLDPRQHQASSLERLGLRPAPRLVAVGSHGQQQGELPLLWGVCNAWVEQGFSVMVLDGHAREDAHNLGLMQALQSGVGPGADPLTQSNWQVWPAAVGLNTLLAASDTTDPMGRLATLFADHNVVLIYTPAPLLTWLLRGSHSAPLLIVPPLHSASVSAYQALKEWVTEGRLQPTVANIALDPTPPMNPAQPAPIEKLQRCAQDHLGYGIAPITVHARAAGEQATRELNRLAWHLFEGALPLHQPQPHEA